jgi:nitrate/nitrite transporter NarK
MIAVGWSSDRNGERRWHTGLCLFAVCIGFFLAAWFQDNIVLALAMFCLAGAGLYGALPSFWSLPSAFLSESAAAASIGLINSIGNLGGFVGPFIVGYLVRVTGSFYGGIIYLSISALAAGILILVVRPERATSR